MIKTLFLSASLFLTSAAHADPVHYYMSILGQISDGTGKPISVITVGCPFTSAQGTKQVEINFYTFSEGVGGKFLGKIQANVTKDDASAAVFDTPIGTMPQAHLTVDRKTSFSVAPFGYRVTANVEWTNVVSLSPTTPLSSRELNPAYPAYNQPAGSMLTSLIPGDLVQCPK